MRFEALAKNACRAQFILHRSLLRWRFVLPADNDLTEAHLSGARWLLYATPLHQAGSLHRTIQLGIKDQKSSRDSASPEDPVPA